jgi:hypothetical protein
MDENPYASPTADLAKTHEPSTRVRVRYWVATLILSGSVAAIGVLAAIGMSIDYWENNSWARTPAGVATILFGFLGPFVPIALASMRGSFVKLKRSSQLLLLFIVPGLHFVTLAGVLTWAIITTGLPL